jgi:hypothetical protein
MGHLKSFIAVFAVLSSGLAIYDYGMVAMISEFHQGFLGIRTRSCANGKFEIVM